MDGDDLGTRFVQAVDDGRGWAEIWELLAHDPWYERELAQWAKTIVISKGAPRHWWEDVAQEAVLLLGRDLRRRRDLGLDPRRAEQSFVPWLQTVIIRHCGQALRKLRTAEQEKPRIAAAAAPAESGAAIDRRLDVAAAVDQIDEPERTAVMLYAQRLTHEEIAAALGVSYWEAYGACQRGLRRLRALLGKSYGGRSPDAP